MSVDTVISKKAPPTAITTTWLDRRKTKNKTIKGVLKAARKMLETDGWAKGTHVIRGCHHASHRGGGRAIGCMCLAGAIRIAINGYDYVGNSANPAKTMVALRAVARHLPGYSSDNLLAIEGIIATWNDMPERTEQEVLDIMDKAIKECKN